MKSQWEWRNYGSGDLFILTDNYKKQTNMTEEKKKLLEEQLDSQQSAIAYDVREFTLE